MRKLQCLLLSLILLFLLLIQSGCQKNNSKLVIGYIKPSINHMPLSFILQQNQQISGNYEMISFTSGWEVQEAIAAGKLDLAIMPFTYAWTLRSKGYKVKTMACLERETDGIVVKDNIKAANDLNHAKIGVLRASSLEALLDDYAARNAIKFTPIYFRTPNELTEALSKGAVDAIVSYVPIIERMPSNLHVLHWFSDDYPGHPCCNLVVTERALETKSKQIYRLMALLQEGIDTFNSKSNDVIDYIANYFNLTPVQAGKAMQHVKFKLKVSAEDIAWERNMMQNFICKGYLENLSTDSDMYYISKD